MNVVEQSVADQVAAVLAGSGRPDRYFAELFGVNQSTVSRLRAAKIKKAHKYLLLLEHNGLWGLSEGDGIEAELSALASAARDQPLLRELISSLHKFVHKAMQK